MKENCLDEVGGRKGSPAQRIKTDQDIEQATHVQKNDPLGSKMGTHTRASIQKFEDAKLPWRRGRR